MLLACLVLAACQAAPQPAVPPGTGASAARAPEAPHATAPEPQGAAASALRDEELRALVDAALREAGDGADFAQGPAWRALVAALLALTPQDVAARAPAPLDPERALAAPADLRGTWVRTRGVVLHDRKLPLQPPVGEVTQIRRAMLRDAEGRELACDLIGDPPPYKTQRDVVEVSGIFLRTVTFESQSQDPARRHPTLPWMLVRSMELVETPGSKLGKSLVRGAPKLIGGVALGVLGVLLFVFYLRRASRAD